MESNVNDVIAWMQRSNECSREGLLLTEPCADGAATTVRARLCGNVLAFWDCSLEPAIVQADASLCTVVVLERLVCELADDAPQLPYAFRLRSAAGEEVLRLSAFSDDERVTWMAALNGATHELASATVADLHAATAAAGNDCGAGNVLDVDERQKSSGGLLTAWTNRQHELALSGERRLHAVESMAESRLSIIVPVQMLKLFRRCCEAMRSDLAGRLRYIPRQWSPVRDTHLSKIAANMDCYVQSIDFMDNYSAANFRPSVAKFRVTFGFAPINLHVQRFHVAQADGTHLTFDSLTGGAPTTQPFLQDGGGSTPQLRHNLDRLLGGGGADCSFSRLSSRRAALAHVAARLASLHVQVLRTFSDDAQQQLCEGKPCWLLLSELQELRTLLLDQAAAGGDQTSLVEQLVSFGSQWRPAVEPADEHFVPDETLDALIDKVEALLVSLRTKVIALDELSPDGVGFTFAQWMETARSTALSCVRQLTKLADTLTDALVFRSLCQLADEKRCNMFYAHQLRSDMLLSQALAIALTAIASRFWAPPGALVDCAVAECWPRAGALLTVVCHLSCYGAERHMIEDMREAWRLLGAVCRVRFVRAFVNVGAPTCVPLLEGDYSAIVVSLPLPEDAFARLPDALQQGDSFGIAPVVWNIGINHEAAFGQKLGENRLEQAINVEASDRLRDYLALLTAGEWLTAAARHRAQSLFQQLDGQVSSNPSEKNTQLLRLAADVCRVLGGDVFFCCKSGKDRTAMAVTLEQGHLLRHNCGLSEHDLLPVVQQMRRDGVRLDNCRKNIGQPVFAFSPFQLYFLPKPYRPPDGTYAQQQS